MPPACSLGLMSHCRVFPALKEYIAGSSVRCWRAPAYSLICDAPHSQSAGRVTVGFQHVRMVSRDTISGLPGGAFISLMARCALLRSTNAPPGSPSSPPGSPVGAVLEPRSTEAGQRCSLTSVSRASSASSSGVTFCCLEPRRRTATDRFSTSLAPTASRTGTLATLCSRTL